MSGNPNHDDHGRFSAGDGSAAHARVKLSEFTTAQQMRINHALAKRANKAEEQKMAESKRAYRAEMAPRAAAVQAGLAFLFGSLVKR